MSRRENHDSSDFYSRFTPPELSADDEVTSQGDVDAVYLGDSRRMTQVADGSVALVVTSPPYFAGKEYEEDLSHGDVPSTYLDYLELLEDTFAECVRKLEPGGRIAVNIANLGRKPYRSLSADIISILQDKLRLLLRGEIVWVKGRGASSSCAWGSFQSAANPVLRDLTERVVIASKGRFDRALTRGARSKRGLPFEGSISKDEFMESTTDVWAIPPESATRVGHPAPFPAELPERLIHLYTYRGDLVLDPFLGSGSTAVAAVRTGRTYVGYDLDAGYVAAARTRIEETRRALSTGTDDTQVVVSSGAQQDHEGDFQSRAVREGRQAKEIAGGLIEAAGFSDVVENKRLPGGVEVSFEARDRRGGRWLFDVCGIFATGRTGFRRMDVVWKALGKAGVLRSAEPGDYRLVFLTTGLPEAGSEGDKALRAARGELFHDLIEILQPEGLELLARCAEGAPTKSGSA